MAVQDIQWCEFFSGKANCTIKMRERGFRSARFDYLYFDKMKKSCKAGKLRRNYMDLLTPAGFMLPACN